MLSVDQARLSWLGWDQWFADRLPICDGGMAAIGRVVADHGSRAAVHTGEEQLIAELGPGLSRQHPPAVGDWVLLRAEGDRRVIDEILPRRSALRRKVAGQQSVEQVLAANVDVVFIMGGLDGEFNPRRIERYVFTAWRSGASPVLLLSKVDLAHRLPDALAVAEQVAAGAPIVPLSAVSGEGLDRLPEFLGAGQTAVLVGSSGVGKSTLANVLAGSEVMQTREIRADGKGRHTTAHRQLVVLPWGGLLIDTPGMRELQLWTDADGVERIFPDVEDLAIRCRFSNCTHSAEPGCAVQEAIARGQLSSGRLNGYRKLTQEARGVGRRVQVRGKHAAGVRRRRHIAKMREEELGGWD